MDLEDDDPFFDPRLRWQKENSEDLSMLTFEKKRFDSDVLLLQFLELKPRVMTDITGHFKWDLSKARRHLQSLRQRGVVLKSMRDKGAGTLCYEVVRRPERLLFFYPKVINKYK